MVYKIYKHLIYIYKKKRVLVFVLGANYSAVLEIVDA